MQQPTPPLSQLSGTIHLKSTTYLDTAIVLFVIGDVDQATTSQASQSPAAAAAAAAAAL